MEESSGMMIYDYDDTPNDMLRDFPDKMPENMLKDMFKNMPKDMLKDMLKHMPREMLRDMLRDMPKDTVKDMLKDMPREMSRDMLKDMPREMSKDMFKKMLRKMSKTHLKLFRQFMNKNGRKYRKNKNSMVKSTKLPSHVTTKVPVKPIGFSGKPMIVLLKSTSDSKRKQTAVNGQLLRVPRKSAKFHGKTTRVPRKSTKFHGKTLTHWIGSVTPTFSPQVHPTSEYLHKSTSLRTLFVSIASVIGGIGLLLLIVFIIIRHKAISIKIHEMRIKFRNPRTVRIIDEDN